MEHLPGPAVRLYRICEAAADDDGYAQLDEAGVCRELGCSSARVRAYRGQLKRAGLIYARRFGPTIRVRILAKARDGFTGEKRATAPQSARSQQPLFDPSGPAHYLWPDRDPAESARSFAHSYQIPLILPAACPHCGENLQSARFGDGEKRALTLTFVFDAGGELVEVLQVTPQRAQVAVESARLDTKSARSARTEAREKARASRALGGGEGGVLIPPGLINKPSPPNPPTAQARALDTSERALSGGAPVPPAGEWPVAPNSNPDYDRNRDLLEDGDLGISNLERADFLARHYAFDELLRMVLAFVRERQSSGSGPGLLIHRLEARLRDRRQFKPRALTAADRALDLYRRHCPDPEPDDAAEYEPEPEPELALESAPGPAGSSQSGGHAPDPGRDLWETCRQQLRLRLPPGTYDAWLRDTAGTLVDDRLVIRASRAGCDFLGKRLETLIAGVAGDVAGRPLELAFEVADGR